MCDVILLPLSAPLKLENFLQMMVLLLLFVSKRQFGTWSGVSKNIGSQ